MQTLRLVLPVVLSALFPAAAATAAVPVPPAEHPRLFLRAKDVADLARRVQHPVLKPVWQELGELSKTNEQIRVETDAARFLLQGDEALGRKTVADALAVLENARFPMHVQDITRPIGRMMVTGAIVYDWCYRLLTAEQKKGFQEQLLRLARDLECGYPPRDIGSVTGHGSEWMIMRDMLAAGIALYDEYPEMYRLAAGRVFQAYVPARNFWYPGHAFHQGSSYAETRFSSDMYPLWIFARLGAGNIFHPAQQFVPYQWIYMRRPDGQMLRAGDGQSRPAKLRSLLSASFYGDGYVLADYLKDPGIDPMHKIFELLWRDPDLKPLPIDGLPLVRHMGFPYGWTVARTGWDADSVIAEMKVNIYNFGNHQHHDAGAFQIYYKGPLAVDSGLYQGSTGAYGSPHHLNYYKRTIAHNSLLIYDPEEQFTAGPNRVYRNDGGQRLPNNWREPRNLQMLLENGYRTGKVLGQSFGPDPKRPLYAWLEGDITGAYSAKVTEVKRSFLFLNLERKDAPAALIVLDRVTASNPAFKKYWLLHSMEEPAISGNGVYVSLSQRGWTGRLHDTVLLPEPDGAEIAKVGGPGKEYWVFGENFPNDVNRGNPLDTETGAWRVEVSPRRAAATDVFLNVMQALDASSPAALPVERFGGGDTIGVRIADRAAVFNASGERTSRPVSFSLRGGGRLRWLVTGLAEGAWQIRRGGLIVEPAVRVADGEGVLWFEGPPGDYELRR